MGYIAALVFAALIAFNVGAIIWYLAGCPFSVGGC